MTSEPFIAYRADANCDVRSPVRFDCTRWRQLSSARLERTRTRRVFTHRLVHRGNSISSQEALMDTTTILVILLVLLIFGGGGWYGRGRWY